MIMLPVIDANDMLIEMTLDDRPFYIGMGWNETGQMWVMNVRDLNKQVLVTGIAAVALWPLLRQVRRPELPPGEFIIGLGRGKTLGRRSFANSDAVLVYFEADEVEEFKANATL